MSHDWKSGRRNGSPLALVLLAGAGWTGFSPPVHASSYRLVYDFSGPDGDMPLSGLTKDNEGRLYGTTSGGGPLGGGVVFRLTKPAMAGGAWSEEILHGFANSDGSLPESPLTLGPSEEVYGTTLQGGPTSRGVVFRLDNLPGWPFTLLHAFGEKPDGAYTTAGVEFGPNGLLYGTTPSGGYKLGGIAFSVSPTTGSIGYAIIHKFGKGDDGCIPAGLATSPTGKLFGITKACSVNYAGTAFSLHMEASANWQEATLYRFGESTEMVAPQDPAMLGKQSFKQELYGCAPGGTHGLGVVYSLSPPAEGSGSWTETVLYNFGDQPNDPIANPHCNVIQGMDGKLFGMTDGGGAYGITQLGRGYGAFFELDPPSGITAGWQEIVLYSFNVAGSGGNTPVGAPVRVGNSFYGAVAATNGGRGGVFKLVP